MAKALPTEIWIRVLENHRSDATLPEMWNSLRHVSTTFRDAVESIFRDDVLPKTWITLMLGDDYDEDTGRIVYNSEFEYQHLNEEDQTLAVFKTETPKEKYQATMKERMEEFTSESFDDPQHTIQIRHDLTDGPLPGFSVDTETFSLSCNWRELFTTFYREIELCSKLDNAYVKSQEGWVVDLKKRMERGEFDMMAMMGKIMTGFAAGSANSMKKARRARIRRQYKDLGIDWNVEDDEDFEDMERLSLLALGQKRSAINLEDYSDDGEDEEDDDSSEEDEWEDEDDEDEDADAGSGVDD